MQRNSSRRTLHVLVTRREKALKTQVCLNSTPLTSSSRKSRYCRCTSRRCGSTSMAQNYGEETRSAGFTGSFRQKQELSWPLPTTDKLLSFERPMLNLARHPRSFLGTSSFLVFEFIQSHVVSSTIWRESPQEHDVTHGHCANQKLIFSKIFATPSPPRDPLRISMATENGIGREAFFRARPLHFLQFFFATQKMCCSFRPVMVLKMFFGFDRWSNAAEAQTDPRLFTAVQHSVNVS